MAVVRLVISEVISVVAAPIASEISEAFAASVTVGLAISEIISVAAACLAFNSGTGTAKTDVMNREVRRKVAVLVSGKNIVIEAG
jgi:hypothetical protein